MGEVKRNCWTCGWADGNACFEPSTDIREFIAEHCSTEDGMPSTDADGCPGWKLKPGAENTDPVLTIGGVRVVVDSSVPEDCVDFVDHRGRQRIRVENTDRAQVAALGIEAGQPVTLRNCWTCGWHLGDGICAVQTDDTGRETLANMAGEWSWNAGLGPDEMPPKDADGCPGWKAKPGAEDADPLLAVMRRRDEKNTDRAQLAILGTDPFPAVEAPECVEDTLDQATVDRLIAEDGETITGDEFNRMLDGATANVGWRGNLPISGRGPGHTTAMRLRRAGMRVRGRKVRR